jgi:hypothetical protein
MRRLRQKDKELADCHEQIKTLNSKLEGVWDTHQRMNSLPTVCTARFVCNTPARHVRHEAVDYVCLCLYDKVSLCLEHVHALLPWLSGRPHGDSVMGAKPLFRQQREACGTGLSMRRLLIACRKGSIAASKQQGRGQQGRQQ